MIHLSGRELAIWVGMFTAIAASFLPILVNQSARRAPYLKRVARKYSVPPLDLR